MSILRIALLLVLVLVGLGLSGVLLLVHYGETGQAASVAERVTDLLSSDYTFKNQKVTLRCRIGISLYPDHGQRAEELIRNADKAMLEAKQDGGKYCIYSAKTL